MTATAEALRQALANRPDHASLCSIRAKPVGRNSIRFLWVDCLTRESGVLAVVPDPERLTTARALLAELHRWRKEATRPKAKGAAA